MKRLLTLLTLALTLTACGAGAPTTQEITITASAMKYSPASLEIKAGQPVRLTFRNNDGVTHDFSVMEFPTTSAGVSVTEDAMAGSHDSQMSVEPQLHVAAVMNGSGTLEFTASQPGTYEFFCTVMGHKAAGMVGTLTVTAP